MADTIALYKRHCLRRRDGNCRYLESIKKHDLLFSHPIRRSPPIPPGAGALVLGVAVLLAAAVLAPVAVLFLMADVIGHPEHWGG